MFKRKTNEYNIHIDKGELISFGRGEYLLSCIRGTLWVTWPGSDDVILRDGDEFLVRHHGKLCIASLTGAFVQVHSKTILPCLKDLPQLAAVKFFKYILSYIRGGDNHSVFGDSVHSIIR